MDVYYGDGCSHFWVRIDSRHKPDLQLSLELYLTLVSCDGDYLNSIAEAFNPP